MKQEDAIRQCLRQKLAIITKVDHTERDRLNEQVRMLDWVLSEHSDVRTIFEVQQDYEVHRAK